MGIETALLATAVAGGLATSGSQIANAGAGGGYPSPTTKRVKLTPQTRAAQSLSARQLAVASAYRPPSFLDYITAGGDVAGPPIAKPTPAEAIDLKLVDPFGKPFDYYTGGALTEEQLLTAGEEVIREKKGAKRTPVKRFARLTRQRARAKKAGDWSEFDRLTRERKKLKKKLGLA